MAIKTKMHFGDQYCKTIWPLLKVEDIDHINLSLVRLACLAERALTLSLTSWPDVI